MASKKSSDPFKLPGFLQVKQTPNQGRGIFTTKRIHCGEEVLRCKPYAVGVSATTAAGLKKLCHNCVKSISTSSSAVVCDRCQVVAYCCKSCQDEALPVHRAECEGLADLEKARGTAIFRPFSECTLDYWPPYIVLLTTRALNRKVMERKSADEWEIAFLSKPEKLPPSKEDGFKNVLQYMWPFVLRSITTEEMLYDAYCRIVINSSAKANTPSGVCAAVVYMDFSLLNHCCAPNCEDETEDGMKVVYALKDIEVGEQLCISYISNVHQLLPGEFRRKKLMEVFGFECICPVCMDEREVGSEGWLLEQQKNLVIAPWSRETTDFAMEEGKNALMKLIQLQENEDWVRVAEEAEAALRKHKGVLDEKNVIRYLLSKALLEAYWQLDQPANGLQIADVVLKSVEEYESPKDVQGILSQISVCYFKVGNVKMGRSLTKKAMKLFPKRLKPQDLCKQLKEQGIPVVMVTSQEELRRRFGAPAWAMPAMSIDQDGKIDVSQLFS